ncbi:MAG: hypothetical protein IT384_21165 [Deltaproteobacteria bacterium]|nr:hypothetical protein [Deltaproteobacteria bacterium]
MPAEVIAQKMAPFDRDGDGALSVGELTEFLSAAGAGGSWFCKLIATTSWRSLEANFSEPITWIKIDALAWWIHEYMKLKPRPAKRVRITPEGAQGYEPLEYLDGTPVDPSAEPRAPSTAARGATPVLPGGKQVEPLTRPPPQPRAQPSAASRGPGSTPAARPATGEIARRPGPGRPSAPRRPGPRR